MSAVSAPSNRGANAGADGAPDDGADAGASEAGWPAAPAPGPFEAFDRSVDLFVEGLRGRRGLDPAAAVVSNLADYGFVWSVIAAAKGRRRGPGRRRAVLALGVAGVASAGVNAAVKAVVGRSRPEVGSAPTGSGLPVRPPSSSSFPSGHTLAAFCTAVVLADSPAEVVAFTGFAAAVAASRVYLRAHHPSDVVGGALIGATVGVVARAAVDRLAPPRR
jgi:undecaprenyl-diphosphatase